MADTCKRHAAAGNCTQNRQHVNSQLVSATCFSYVVHLQTCWLLHSLSTCEHATTRQTGFLMSLSRSRSASAPCVISIISTSWKTAPSPLQTTESQPYDIHMPVTADVPFLSLGPKRHLSCDTDFLHPTQGVNVTSGHHRQCY